MNSFKVVFLSLFLLLPPTLSFSKQMLYHCLGACLENANFLFKAGYIKEEHSDEEGALRLYKRAAQKQHAGAANRIGIIMESIDVFSAIEWHTKAIAWTQEPFDRFSISRGLDHEYSSLGLAFIPFPGALSALRLAYLFRPEYKYSRAFLTNNSEESEEFESNLEKSEEYYKKAHSLGVPALVIGGKYERFAGATWAYKPETEQIKRDLKKAIEWYKKETMESGVAISYLIGLALEKLGEMEEAVQWYKRAMREEGEKVVKDIWDEKTTKIYEEIIGKHGLLVNPSRTDPIYASKAAIKLGQLYYTGHLELADHTNTAMAYWFYAIANLIDKDRNIFLKVAEEQEKTWEKTKKLEDLKWTIKLYREARDNHYRHLTHTFSQDSYNAKMAELNLILATHQKTSDSDGNCKSFFKKGS